MRAKDLKIPDEKELEQIEHDHINDWSLRIRDWYARLNDAILGEIGISWEKYHKVLDDMKEFVEQLEKVKEVEF